MHVFWKNGYEATSTRMLEKEMGINQFSIYASFKNKQGIFLETIKCYKKELANSALNKLLATKDGVLGIKEYFYDFLKFTKDETDYKGCFLTNTKNELGNDIDAIINSEINQFAQKVYAAFVSALKMNSKLNDKDAEIQADYLFISLQGLSTSSKMVDNKQLDSFIEMTFRNV
jgi:AcrR family transcriptional regulator